MRDLFGQILLIQNEKSRSIQVANLHNCTFFICEKFFCGISEIERFPLFYLKCISFNFGWYKCKKKSTKISTFSANEPQNWNPNKNGLFLKNVQILVRTKIYKKSLLYVSKLLFGKRGFSN